jgi:hypothetical protein
VKTVEINIIVEDTKWGELIIIEILYLLKVNLEATIVFAF